MNIQSKIFISLFEMSIIVFVDQLAHAFLEMSEKNVVFLYSQED